MARRRNSALDFIKSFNAVYDTVGKVGQDFELSRVANAKPTTTEGFTAEQGEQLRQAGEAGSHVNYDQGAKAYTITPKLGAEEMGPAAPKIVAQQGVTDFLGTRTAGIMGQDQQNSARFKAMAGVISKYDPVAGMKLQREAKNDERDDQRFAWEKSRGEREMKKADKDEAYEEGLQKEYGQTQFARNMGGFAPQMQEYQAKLAEYDAQVKAGAAPQQLGLRPQAPARPGYSIAQSMADQGRLLAYKAQHGKADPTELASYAQTYQKVTEEGYGRALKLAQTGAPIEKIAEQFAQSGDARLDPANVVADRMVKGADGVASRVIDFKGPDGQVQSINVLAELDALGQADSYFNRFWKSEDNRRGNEQSTRADKQLNESIRHNRASEGISAMNARAAMGARGEAKTAAVKKAQASLALYLEKNPNATQAQRDAVLSGILSPVPKGAEGYKTESGDVTALLGTPAVGPDGKPVMDAFSGRQVVNRDTQREQQLWKYMRDKGITDTNEGLQRFLQDIGASAAGTPGSAAPKKADLKVGQIYDTPRGKMVWGGDGFRPAK